MSEWAAAFLASLMSGVLSGWGVGGGTLLLMVMTLFLGAPQQEARAVNLLFFLPTAALSLIFHRKNGLVDRADFWAAAVPGTAAALLAAAVSFAVDGAVLRKPFGMFLVAAGVVVLRNAWKEGRK